MWDAAAILPGLCRDHTASTDFRLRKAFHEEDGGLLILYEFSGSYKQLKGFHREISQGKKRFS